VVLVLSAHLIAVKHQDVLGLYLNVLIVLFETVLVQKGLIGLEIRVFGFAFLLEKLCVFFFDAILSFDFVYLGTVYGFEILSFIGGAFVYV
jgi:hypothetical protein